MMSLQLNSLHCISGIFICLVLITQPKKKSPSLCLLQKTLPELFPVKDIKFVKVVVNVCDMIFSAVMSLKCNICSSAESWDKCSNTEMTCPSGIEERCVKVEFKYGETKSFTRTCGTKDYCDKGKNPTCNLVESVSGVECNVNCCEGDLCNAGSAAKISGIMLLACALAVLMFKGA